MPSLALLPPVWAASLGMLRVQPVGHESWPCDYARSIRTASERKVYTMVAVHLLGKGPG
jgi:hypothetical protein